MVFDCSTWSKASYITLEIALGLAMKRFMTETEEETKITNERDIETMNYSPMLKLKNKRKINSTRNLSLQELFF